MHACMHAANHASCAPTVALSTGAVQQSPGHAPTANRTMRMTATTAAITTVESSPVFLSSPPLAPAAPAPPAPSPPASVVRASGSFVVVRGVPGNQRPAKGDAPKSTSTSTLGRARKPGSSAPVYACMHGMAWMHGCMPVSDNDRLSEARLRHTPRNTQVQHVHNGASPSPGTAGEGTARR